MSIRSLVERVQAYRRRESGAAAAEFAIWLAVLAPVFLNVIDLALYAYDKVQVANAGQAAAQAAWTVAYNTPCTIANNLLSTSKNPSTTCTGLDAAVNYAIAQSSFLSITNSGAITRPTTSSKSGSTYTNELYGYYCPAQTTGVLTATTNTKCPNTSAVQNATAGYYYKIEVTYSYHPMFGGVSVASLLGTSITQDTWVRLQ